MENTKTQIEIYEKLKYETIYLLREREFIISGLDIYKFGKSIRPGLVRLNDYPKGSEVVCVFMVKNSSIIENKIKELFKQKYTPTKFGYEYFIGNYKLMRKDIINIIEEEDDKNEIEIVNEDDKNEIEIVNEDDETEEKISHILTETEIKDNLFKLFVKETHLIKTDEPKDKITKSQLNEEFKIWACNQHNLKQIPKANELHTYINNNFDCRYDASKHILYGIKFIYNNRIDEELEEL